MAVSANYTVICIKNYWQCYIFTGVIWKCNGICYVEQQCSAY